MQKNLKITGAVFVFLSLVFLVQGGYGVIKEQLFVQSAEHTTAILIENKRHEDTGDASKGVQYYYCPQYQFETKNGQSISFEVDDNCSQLGSPPRYRVGKKWKSIMMCKIPSEQCSCAISFLNFFVQS